ncbi:MAG: 2,3-bisphosphoglycerate-independent phosphoglycerate mutase [Zoogloeaceae bacterium]|jgi:2,3-bisphosphoglycerate-independent phosphoglycerate mutase|nr:2,3-bisphosphoglycerate-independent phosphoglycerate mutase [Zoogloeaceae bacterium]
MLSKSPFPGVTGPVALIVLDGHGVSANPAALGNAIAAASTPTLDRLFADHPNILLKAHGTAVGMPSDEDMGNSEVGHNAIGAGQIYAQGAALVAKAIENGSLWQGSGWQEIIAQIKANAASVLHLMGIFSDGNVHSHIDHLKAMLIQAGAEGVRRARVHVLLDGRDVPETSALDYIEPFEDFLAGLARDGLDARIASGGGRQVITMDRYEADWRMVERGWQTHVLGEGEFFPDCATAVRTLRARHPGVIDQDLPPFVIADAEGKPIGAIRDGDAVALFNFRGDRAIEITRAFDEAGFDKFDRKRVPRIAYAGMLQYDGDLALPKRFLVSPPAIRNTLSEWLSGSGIAQFACSETQKFGHVTYFWNGNRSVKFPLETWQEIKSDCVPCEERPWMKSAEIADALIAAIESGRYRFLRCNFANGDMVGHTGDFRAATLAVEAVDLALSRVLPVIGAAGGAALITADHGNADEMFELDAQKPRLNPDGSPKAKTAHTLNPVPLILYEPSGQLTLKTLPDAGLAHLAASVTQLLGLEKHPSWKPGLVC